MKTFETSDIGIAAYIMMRGLKLLKATRSQSGRFKFVFDDKNDDGNDNDNYYDNSNKNNNDDDNNDDNNKNKNSNNNINNDDVKTAHTKIRAFDVIGPAYVIHNDKNIKIHKYTNSMNEIL